KARTEVTDMYRTPPSPPQRPQHQRSSGTPVANTARERGTRLVEVGHKNRNGKGWATQPDFVRMCFWSFALRDSNEDIVRQNAIRDAEWLDSINGQLSQKLRFVKSVLCRMVQKRAIDPSVQSGAGYFFKKERSRRLEDTLNFCDTRLPVHNMMQHPEVENRIEVFIRIRKVI